MQRVKLWINAVLLMFGAVFPSVSTAQDVTVFAASSLRDALGTVAAEFEREGGGRVALVPAASSAIARQVAQGAPADVVLFADPDWGDWLVDQGTVEATQPFASNRLAMMARDWVMVSDDTLGAVLADSILATAQVDAVPAGRYARAALTSLGHWETVAPNTVQAANVRAALRFVQRGEADFAIGYASDLVALPDLAEVYAFAPDSHPPIIYVGAHLTPKGRAFMDYLLSPAGQDILGDWGFAPVPDLP